MLTPFFAPCDLLMRRVIVTVLASLFVCFRGALVVLNAVVSTFFAARNTCEMFPSFYFFGLVKSADFQCILSSQLQFSSILTGARSSALRLSRSGGRKGCWESQVSCRGVCGAQSECQCARHGET
jgi:hypothetical protein